MIHPTWLTPGAGQISVTGVPEDRRPLKRVKSQNLIGGIPQYPQYGTENFIKNSESTENAYSFPAGQ